MTCPKCDGKTTVKRPYHTSDNENIRHRVCLGCGHNFYTVEYEVEYTPKLKSEMSAAYSIVQAKYRQKYKDAKMKGAV